MIGVPHEKTGEAPKAYVVLKPDQSLSEAGVIDALKSSLDEYKLPAHVVFIDAIPKSPSGKILRRMLPQ